MYDYRNEIIKLAEEMLHAFFKIRLKDLEIEDTWFVGLKNYVINEYDSHKSNYEKLYIFFQNHSEDEIIIDQLDITALMAIINYFLKYIKKKEITNVSNDSNQLFTNHIMAIRDLRNTFDHTTRVITDNEYKDIYYNQLYHATNLSNFAILVLKHYDNPSEWKRFYWKAKGIEQCFYGEKWLAIKTNSNLISPEDNFSDLLNFAKNGDTNAQLLVGKAYHLGKRTKKDDEAAYIWLRKAALKNNPEAQMLLGGCYLLGTGVDRDPNKAKEWFTKSAEQNYAPAQYELAMTYFEYNTPEDEKLFFHWLRLAVNQNHPEAIKTLAIFYRAGKGVEKDTAKARELLIKAAELGNFHACEMLAEDAQKNKNYQEAIEWYSLADKEKYKRKILLLERLLNQ